MKTLITMIAASIALTMSAWSHAGENKVPYPDGYRNWSHVKSMIIESGHALENPFKGIHHVYANKRAMEGLKQGRYENGSVFVFDLLNAVRKDYAIQESDRKLVGVMLKDTDKYRKTGGWGFEGFAADSRSSRLTSDGGVSCFDCHASESNNDYVFTEMRK